MGNGEADGSVPKSSYTVEKLGNMSFLKDVPIPKGTVRRPGGGIAN